VRCPAVRRSVTNRFTGFLLRQMRDVPPTILHRARPGRGYLPFPSRGTFGAMSADGYGKAVLNALNPLHRDLRAAIPDAYAGFREMHHGAMAAGALEVKTKELIAMAIGVIEGCDGCIASHARGAARAGATKQEAAEAIGVTFLMKGGPATIYGPRAYAAFCEFADALAGQGQPAADGGTPQTPRT
jgi:AhpD family alkylhydroperoxidase